MAGGGCSSQDVSPHVSPARSGREWGVGLITSPAQSTSGHMIAPFACSHDIRGVRERLSTTAYSRRLRKGESACDGVLASSRSRPFPRCGQTAFATSQFASMAASSIIIRSRGATTHRPTSAVQAPLDASLPIANEFRHHLAPDSGGPTQLVDNAPLPGATAPQRVSRLCSGRRSQRSASRRHRPRWPM